jgi:hypothetical protein
MRSGLHPARVSMGILQKHLFLVPMRFFRKNKYRAKRSVCFLGHNHPSMVECRFCEALQAAKKDGSVKEFFYEMKYDLMVNGIKIGSHKPDFTVIYPDGRTVVQEIKGYVTRDFILRKKIFEANYPKIPYIIIK